MSAANLASWAVPSAVAVPCAAVAWLQVRDRGRQHLMEELRRQTKPSNGRTLATIVEEMSARMTRMERKLRKMKKQAKRYQAEER